MSEGVHALGFSGGAAGNPLAGDGTKRAAITRTTNPLLAFFMADLSQGCLA
jgi:hypothetical protein